MSRANARLLDELREVAEELPTGLLYLAAGALSNCRPGDWEAVRRSVQHAVSQPEVRAVLGRLVDCWQVEAPELTPASVGLALEAAAHTVDHARRSQSLELVWTGPTSQIPLRRTAQALQQLIDEAQSNLLVVSYAVYDIPEIGQALARAACRDVRLRLVIESPEAEGGHIAYNALAAFGSEIQARAEIYRWPAEQRPTDRYSHKLAALHAKCAVADESILLVSSANLTRYALSLNMEMGLLVRGGHLPSQVSRHFSDLVGKGVLIRAN